MQGSVCFWIVLLLFDLVLIIAPPISLPESFKMTKEWIDIELVQYFRGLFHGTDGFLLTVKCTH